MVKQIVVLSDGTWETIGEAKILTITDDAHDSLLDGATEISDLTDADILGSVMVERPSYFVGPQ
jgi:hypothetical protein